jgi:hypothetical protein
VFVLDLDQRASTDSVDLIDDWRHVLNEEFSGGLRLPFVRTAGDEMQAVVESADSVVDIVLRATRKGEWWVGVGLGGIDAPLGDTARDSRGPAFRHAREAVGAAKRSPWGCAVQGEPGEVARRVEACLALLVFLRNARTDRSWHIVDLVGRDRRAVDVARELGISKQAVSKHLRAAGHAEEIRGRELAISLLQET